MKTKLFVHWLILVLFFPVLLNAQLQNSKWYFGSDAGVDFNDGTQPPTLLTDNSLIMPNGTATVSDESGNLLFYTNGSKIFNRNQEVMLNGDNIGGDINSSNVLIIPVPFQNDKYYIFTAEYQVGQGNGLNYSIVDMSLDNGNGQVIETTNLLERTSQKIAVTKNTFDDSYWLAVFATSTDINKSDTFYIYKINTLGISLISQYTIPFIVNRVSNPEGQMKFSPDNQNLVLIHNTSAFFTELESSVYILDFDEVNGIVSNPNSDLGFVGTNKYYGAEFSPDSNLLYVSEIQNNKKAITGIIYQVNYRSINPTRNTITDNLGSKSIFGLQLATDGKIYTVDAQFFLGAINNPNLIGSAANYNASQISLGVGKTTKGLPLKVPKIIASNKAPFVKTLNTLENDTITFLKAKNDGFVIFGNIGEGNQDNLPSSSNGFIADYNENGDIKASGINELPYSVQLNIDENSYKWEEQASTTGLNGQPNSNYLLSKYDSENQLEFQVTTTNINENIIENKENGEVYLMFPTTSDQDYSIVGVGGKTWSKSASQIFVLDKTQFTRTYNIARFDNIGNLLNVTELLNYKWARDETSGTTLVEFKNKEIGSNQNIFFTNTSRDENEYIDAAKISLTNGETYKKGEWLVSYSIIDNSFKNVKINGQKGSIKPHELIYNNSKIYIKRKNKLYKLDDDLNVTDSLIANKLEVLDINQNDETFLIRADNLRTLKKIDSNFNEIWSKLLGKKFNLTHASQATNGDIYIAGSYTEDAIFEDTEKVTLIHSGGTDIFFAKLQSFESQSPAGIRSENNKKYSEFLENNSQGIIKKSFSVFPNPVSNKLTVSSLTKGKAQLYDINGKVVITNVDIKNGNQNFIDISKLNNGVYFLRFIDNNSKIVNKKIIKK